MRSLANMTIYSPSKLLPRLRRLLHWPLTLAVLCTFVLTGENGHYSMTNRQIFLKDLLCFVKALMCALCQRG